MVRVGTAIFGESRMKITFIGGGNMANALIGGLLGRVSRRPTSVSSSRWPENRERNWPPTSAVLPACAGVADSSGQRCAGAGGQAAADAQALAPTGRPPDPAAGAQHRCRPAHGRPFTLARRP
jgi:hypothetical protein